MGRKVTTEDFIEKAKKVHSSKYDYSKSVYTATRNFMIITCPIHGDFNQRANCHTSGRGCSKCGKKSTASKRIVKEKVLLERLINRFGDMYEYDFSGYEYNKSKIKVTCKKHGDFYKSINHLMYKKGCSKCSSENHKGKFKTSTQAEFLKKAFVRHGELYDYSVSDYINAITPIKIICSAHGIFEQTPHIHLLGSGCSKCNKGGYSRSDYVKQAKGRDGVIYIIKLSNEIEIFYKIGITFQSVHKRYKGTNSIPYNYEIIYEHACDAGCTWDLEKEHHKQYKSHQYFPKIYFAGYTECFNLSLPIEQIIENLKIL